MSTATIPQNAETPARVEDRDGGTSDGPSTLSSATLPGNHTLPRIGVEDFARALERDHRAHPAREVHYIEVETGSRVIHLARVREPVPAFDSKGADGSTRHWVLMCDTATPPHAQWETAVDAAAALVAAGTAKNLPLKLVSDLLGAVLHHKSLNTRALAQRNN